MRMGGYHCVQVIASTDPKPVPGDWSGNGAPVKFSTRETREEGKGWFVIQEHLRRLQQVRAETHSAGPSHEASKIWWNAQGKGQ